MDQFFDMMKNLGPGRLVTMLGTFFALIVFFIFIAVKSSAPTLTLLYGDLSTGDSTEIAARLDNVGISYRLGENGSSVSVADKDVGRARMLLAQEGLPRKGSMGYEIFDQKQSFGTTSFQQNINQLRALEGELSRTISTIENIRNARVHLVLPQRELFSRETRPATASVFLNIKSSAALGTEQIHAIQHLVAAAVPQLKAANVAVVDQNGNLLARGEDSQDPASARGGADLKNTYESRLTRSLEDMISRIVGYGKVRTTVTADLNFDVISRNSESYNPDGQVVRSTQTITDESTDSSESQNAAVSVENNLPGLPLNGGEGAAVGSKSSRTEEVTNFEISKTIENLVRESGEVQKLSVAVLVDGRYEVDANAVKPEGAAEDWMAPRVYVPRTQEELDKIAMLVKSAIGYDESRGDTVEVVNMQFAESDMFDAIVPDDKIMGFARADVMGMAETLILSVVAVLIILLVLRPLATHFAATARENSGGGLSAQGETALLAGATPGMQPQLAGPGGMDGENSELDSMIDMSSVEGRVKASSVQKISELVTNHPGETVSVIRQWMSQES